jgi:hypothetical protein
MPSRRTADRVARWPGPVIFDARIGSFASMAVSTTRRPSATTSEILLKAPAGTEPSGHAISRSDMVLSSLPKRSGLLATTMVSVGIAFFCASMLRRRISAWLFSQDCARNTASRPNTTAKPIITIVLERTGDFPFGSQAVFRRPVAANIGPPVVLNW